MLIFPDCLALRSGFEMGGKYDVIVMGQAMPAVRRRLPPAAGCKTLVMSIYLDTVGHMPCSPSIGGIGKGCLVREIDALGGEMARVSDQSAIQFRLLNTKKGPAGSLAPDSKRQSALSNGDEAQIGASTKSGLKAVPGRVPAYREWKDIGNN